MNGEKIGIDQRESQCNNVRKRKYTAPKKFKDGDIMAHHV